MRRPLEIAGEVRTMMTVGQLAGAFEGIASMHIARIKDQVVESHVFFDDIWEIYTQLRVDESFHAGRNTAKPTSNKELIIIITSEGSLSGDIDQMLVDTVLHDYDKHRNAIIAMGHHGAFLLKQANIEVENVFKLPERDDQEMDFGPIMAEIQKYSTCRVYYQAYVSLMRQEVKNIELSQAVVEQGKAARLEGDFISPDTYIFEPSVYAVVDHMEQTMMQIALGQVVLESKLAQYASRFRAMTMAHKKARDARHYLSKELNRAKRALKDERTKEIINGMRKERVRI